MKFDYVLYFLATLMRICWKYEIRARLYTLNCDYDVNYTESMKYRKPKVKFHSFKLLVIIFPTEYTKPVFLMSRNHIFSIGETRSMREI
jgi:hypothetical protein